MGKCDWVTWSGSRKFFGAAGGSFMILMSVLTIIGVVALAAFNIKLVAALSVSLFTCCKLRWIILMLI